MRSSISLRTLVIAALAVVATDGLVGTAHAHPPLSSNARRYRDNGHHPSRRRSGRASIEARALVDKDRITNVEISTGQLDSDTPPSGVLTKVRIAITSPTFKHKLVRKYTQLPHSGYALFTYGDLASGETLDIHAQVTGFDGRRTDVAAVQTQVMPAPDLQVLALRVPYRSVKNTDVAITAVVRETNGFVGGAADCVLYVSDQPADRAPRIWVDADGTVSCQFTHRFDAPGDVPVRVALEGSRPRDYDLSNNSASAIVRVIDDPVEFSYVVWATNTYVSGVRTMDGWYTYPAPEADFHVETSRNGWVQERHLWAYIPAAVNFPISSVTVEDFADGETISSVSFSNLEAQYPFTDHPPARGDCVEREADGVWTSFCTYINPPHENTFINSWRNAGDVTFHSIGRSRRFLDVYSGATFDPGLGYYTWNYDIARKSQATVRGENATTYGMRLSIDDNGSIYEINPSFPMTTRVLDLSVPYACDNAIPPLWSAEFGGRFCRGLVLTNTIHEGSQMSNL